MQILKNISVGFLVSFIGSIPLGYLNLVGFDIYSHKGLAPTLNYLFGVVAAEVLFISLTLVFADKLASNKNLVKYIEGFSAVFMLVLALVFYFGTGMQVQNQSVFSNIESNFFLAGLVFSCLNFVQLPFWAGWNLYLLNSDHIKISGTGKFFYVFGAISGTYVGMLLLILALHFFAANVVFLSRYLMHIIVPIVFLLLGLFHAVKFFRKYRP